MLLVLNLPLAPLWAKLLRIPRSYLYAGILFFSSLGAYAANANTFDLFLLLVIGALGFMMRRYGLPILPAIIGVILGPFAEEKLRQALQISNGDLSGLIDADLDRRLRHRRADPAVAAGPPASCPARRFPSVLDEAAHEIEEAHQHHGLTSAVSVERHVGDARRPRRTEPDPGGTETARQGIPATVDR